MASCSAVGLMAILRCSAPSAAPAAALRATGSTPACSALARCTLPSSRRAAWVTLVRS
ncbi:hypothetical protein F751_2745 [Auxenochlorella protothecoides]|uniref:Uncharacterized protein n=1 Tax=Auxenochlorella protothecoides TaxID=3075 RepID=A0A087SPV0_AUXPR|nr:hypothetical protein F751_2745 [Auxenochlorella protothecoides]KFM27754.1 hypothetical protein F751_2745 [Auxenochlorella protothecoides]